MSRYPALIPYTTAIDQCVRCGACQAHCPVYHLDRHEGAVARGKVALAKGLLSGGLPLDRRVEQDISLCLMCGSCVDKCPNKVPTDAIVGAMRREIKRARGLTSTGKAIATLTGSPAMLQAVTKTLRVITPALFRRIPQTSGLRLRFPLAGQSAQRTLPPIAASNLFSRLPEWIQGRTDKPVVGLFAGCAITYLYPEIGVAMASLLHRLGYTVYFPHAQGCCGIPARSTGDAPLIERLTATNRAAYSNQKLKYIVTACASCNSGLRAMEPDCPDDASAFADKVIDIHTLLCREGVPEQLAALPGTGNQRRITYHDPCHLRTKGITDEPRALLQALPDVEYVEMKDSALCCGLGGSFSVTHYAYSRRIGQRKAEGIKNSRADIVATACPGCMLQLQDSINHAQLPVQAVHSLDLIQQALERHVPHLLRAAGEEK